MSRPLSELSVFAFLFIFFGLLLLVENYTTIYPFSRLWPLLIVFLGFGLLLVFYRRRRSDLFLLGMASFMLQIGLFFQYLNFTTWRQMAELWPLFIGFLSISCLWVAFYERVIKVLYYISIVLGMLCVSFMLVFNIDPKLWPITLVFFGISLLIIRRFGI